MVRVLFGGGGQLDAAATRGVAERLFCPNLQRQMADGGHQPVGRCCHSERLAAASSCCTRPPTHHQPTHAWEMNAPRPRPGECAVMMYEMDGDGDGKVSVEEFCHWWTGLGLD